jgi:hypothetical protein
MLAGGSREQPSAQVFPQHYPNNKYRRGGTWPYQEPFLGAACCRLIELPNEIERSDSAGGILAGRTPGMASRWTFQVERNESYVGQTSPVAQLTRLARRSLLEFQTTGRSLAPLQPSETVHPFPGVYDNLGVAGVTKGLQERSIDTRLVGSFRMGARAVDWARLESVCTARYRGFESLPIRHISACVQTIFLSLASNRLPGRVKEMHVFQIKIVTDRIGVAEVVKSSQADGEPIVRWRQTMDVGGFS